MGQDITPQTHRIGKWDTNRTSIIRWDEQTYRNTMEVTVRRGGGEGSKWGEGYGAVT